MIGYATLLIFFTFLDFGHLQGVTGVGEGGLNSDQKSRFWVSHFCENSKFSKIIQNLFVSISGENFSKIGP